MPKRGTSDECNISPLRIDYRCILQERQTSKGTVGQHFTRHVPIVQKGEKRKKEDG